MAMKNRARFLEKLKRIQGAPRKAMRGALDEGARQIVSTARSLAPKKSGALAASIGHTFGDFAPANGNVRGFGGEAKGDADLTVTIHAGDAAAFYAAFVEFGTKKHDAGGMFEGAEHPGATPQPFFFPAYRANKRSVKARISRAMRAAIRKEL